MWLVHFSLALSTEELLLDHLAKNIFLFNTLIYIILQKMKFNFSHLNIILYFNNLETLCNNILAIKNGILQLKLEC